MRHLRETADGRSLRVALAVSRYNGVVTDGLQRGALDALAACGEPEGRITVVSVPGALELPLVLRELALTGGFDALVALGAVIRGETDHYLHVCTEVTRGCGCVALETGVPVGFGVLTCETLALARDRSSANPKNKGAEAARSAVEAAAVIAAVRALPETDAGADASAPEPPSARSALPGERSLGGAP